MADVATIRDTYKRLHEDGLPISEQVLRHWVKTGVIPSIECGVKRLLYYPAVVELIKTGTTGGDKE